MKGGRELALTCLFLILYCGTALAQANEGGGYTLIARAIERIVIVVFGGCSLLLGYRLFRVTAQSAAELSAGGHGWTFRMVQVGPGVFFALFGAAVLALALHQAPTVKHSASESVVSGALPTAVRATTPQDEIRALNTLSQVLIGAADQSQRKRAQAALDQLEPMKRGLVDQVLGANRYNKWSAMNQRRVTDSAALTKELTDNPSLAREFNETDTLLSQTIP
jgi:hypothetical protein